MSLQTYLPQAPLSDYVHLLWYWKDYHPPHPRERILPGGMMEIVINLTAEPFQITYPQAGTQTQRISGAMAAGARSQHFLIDTTRPATLLAVWFKPGGALPFFGVPAADLHNLHLPLETLWGTAAKDLYEQLLEAPSPAACFRILEGALLRRLLAGAERHRAVEYALALLHRQPQPQRIAAIVDEIALSPTRFIQLFRDDVGFAPKLFCRIQRFQQALRLAAHDPARSWADVALTCGYYDQSHFINDFQAFAGIPPGAYVPQSRDHPSNLPVFD